MPAHERSQLRSPSGPLASKKPEPLLGQLVRPLLVGPIFCGRSRSLPDAELSDMEKPPVLRAYLKRWKAEVGIFFDGVSAGSPEDDLARIAPRHPVFSVETS